MSELKQKVDFAIKLLQKAAENAEKNFNEPLEICYSGGKDSDVLLHLANMANINFKAYYKNTTIDPQGTLKHVKENGVEIIQPQKKFFELVKIHGMPSRFYRFCCSNLKEYKILNCAAVGVRADESSKRKKRYTEPEQCRIYTKEKKVKQYFPLLFWSIENLAEFVTTEKIRLAPIYYNTDGTINFKKRLGCFGCPLKADNGRGDFILNPKFFKILVKNVKYQWDNNKNTNQNQYQLFKDFYEKITYNLFFDSMKDFNNYFNNPVLFCKPNAKQLLERYFNIELNF